MEFDDDYEACRFLESRGFTLSKDGKWEWLRATPPDDDENNAIHYLFWEWDFGDYRCT